MKTFTTYLSVKNANVSSETTTHWHGGYIDTDYILYWSYAQIMTCWLKGSIATGFYSWLYAPHTCTRLYCGWPCLEEGSFQFCTAQRHGVSQVFNFLKGALFWARCFFICNRQVSLHFRKCLYFGCLLCAKICGNFSLPEPAWASYGIECSPSYSYAIAAGIARLERDKGGWQGDDKDTQTWGPQQALKWVWR